MHSVGRAAMGEKNLHSALYIYTNQQLLYKAELARAGAGERLSSAEAAAVVSLGVDADGILGRLRDVDVRDYLPAERQETDEEDDEMDEEDEVPECNIVYLDTFEAPEGFEFVPTPDAFLDKKTLAEGSYYMVLRVDDGTWMTGCIADYHPRAKKWNFTIIWENGTPEKQHVKLSNYHESGDAEDGAWAYMKRSSSNKRGRDARDDDDDEGPNRAAPMVTPRQG